METPSLGDLLTIFGGAAALAGYLYDNHKDREAKQEEIDQQLKESYYEIFKLLIENPHLHSHDNELESAQDRGSQLLIYEMLVSHFETAYMRLAHDKGRVEREMWASWEDAIHEWIVRPNFLNALPKLLKGENPAFAEYMRAKVDEHLNSLRPPQVILLGVSQQESGPR